MSVECARDMTIMLWFFVRAVLKYFFFLSCFTRIRRRFFFLSPSLLLVRLFLYSFYFISFSVGILWLYRVPHAQLIIHWDLCCISHIAFCCCCCRLVVSMYLVVSLLRLFYLYLLSTIFLSRFSFTVYVYGFWNIEREYLASKCEVRLTIYENDMEIWLRESNCIHITHHAQTYLCKWELVGDVYRVY